METGGVDTMHVSYWLEWTSKTADVGEELFQAQEIARREGTNEESGELPAVNVGGWLCEVLPYGFKANKKASGSFGYFPLAFRVADMLVGISDREVSDLTRNPNMRIELGSLGLMHNGLRGQLETINEIIEGIGAKVLKNAVGRVDVCVDLPGVHVSSLQKAVLDGRVVSKCKARDQHGVYDTNESGEITLSSFKKGRQDTGVVLGRGDIVCRMYDKLDEIRAKQAQAKYEVLCEKRWGSSPCSATRVEFQLRRDALRELRIPATEGGFQWGIVSIDEWLQYEHQICMYLCQTWLRVYDKEFDSQHTERLTFDDMHPDWQKVVNAFESWTIQPDQRECKGEVQRKEKPLTAGAVSLVRNGIGSLRSALAKCGHVIDTTANDWAQKFAYQVWQMVQYQTIQDGPNTFEKRQARTFLRMHVCGEYDPPAGIGLFGLSQ